MPKLSEVLAAILADVSTARQMADVETTRIAQRYQRHELLRGLSVPRIRLPELTIELPVLIQSVESPAGMQAPASGGASAAPSVPSPAPVSVASSQSEVDVARRAIPSADTVAVLGADVLRRVEETAGQKPAKPEASSGHTALSSASAADALPAAQSITVLVATDELMAKGTSATITRLRLSIREDGVEWDDDNDGHRGLDGSGRVPRLIPE